MTDEPRSADTPNCLSDTDRTYWQEQSQRIDWHQPFTEISRLLDDGPRRHWFADGLTNLCHNAIDRHLPRRGDQTALIHIDANNRERRFSYRDLHREVQIMAALLQDFGVIPGDRVAIYLPMIPEALIAMLACTRIGAVHVVIFAGLPTTEIVTRLHAVNPSLLIAADGGLDGRHWRRYRPLLAKAQVQYAASLPIVIIDRDLDSDTLPLPQEFSYAALYQRFANARVACTWLPSQTPSHILHTSGTNGHPKGIVRDTGGYGVALATSLEEIYEARDGDIVFTSADVGWVVGHSYLVYAPLINGLTSVMVEGGPCHTGPERWWRLVEQLGITHLLAAPSAVRQLRKTSVNPGNIANLSSLRRIFLAGEPLDATSAAWLRESTSSKVINHYWQTESGWPILAGDSRTGVLSPVLNRCVAIVDDQGNQRCHPGVPGSIVVKGHLSPGGMLSLWQNDDLHDKLYWTRQGRSWCYSTHDWGVMDIDGQLQILGRTDDVINVGGRRLSTVEIEHIVLKHPAIVDTAVIGGPHPLLGQIPILFVVLAEPGQPKEALLLLKRQLRQNIISSLGRHALSRKIKILDELPRTRSGKIQRKLISLQ